MILCFFKHCVTKLGIRFEIVLYSNLRPQMDFCWELVMYHLEITDISHVCRTCKTGREIGLKESLWTVLMNRDFPLHVQDCAKSQHRLMYQDLYLYGAYYQFALGKIQLHPDRPVCMFMLYNRTAQSASSERVAITYRKSASHLQKRNAFEDRLYRIPSDWLEPKDHAGMINGDFLPERAFGTEKYFFCISTWDISWLEPEIQATSTRKNTVDTKVANLRNPFLKPRDKRKKSKGKVQKAIREPFTWDRSDFEKWIHVHFDVQEMFVIAPYANVMVIGSLKKGNQLSCPRKILKTYNMCGDSGVEVDGQPCQHAITGYGPTSPYYGRCTAHPREQIDDSIYEFSNYFYSGEGRFSFIDNKIVLSTKDLTVNGKKDPSFTHMNNQPLQDVRDPWL